MILFSSNSDKPIKSNCLKRKNVILKVKFFKQSCLYNATLIKQKLPIKLF